MSLLKFLLIILPGILTAFVMNINALREQHDQLLASLYEQEVLLRQQMPNSEYYTENVEIAEIIKRIKALEASLNEVRISMYYS